MAHRNGRNIVEPGVEKGQKQWRLGHWDHPHRPHQSGEHTSPLPLSPLCTYLTVSTVRTDIHEVLLPSWDLDSAFRSHFLLSVWILHNSHSLSYYLPIKNLGVCTNLNNGPKDIHVLIPTTSEWICYRVWEKRLCRYG